jgi:integrase
MLHFEEKGGKSREIPVRHHLRCKLRSAPKDRTSLSYCHPQNRPTHRARHSRQRRLPNDETPPETPGSRNNLSPHSFRVTTITDLLEQGVPLEDVQRLAGHADPRTTRLYDRRDKKVTTNVVERISV